MTVLQRADNTDIQETPVKRDESNCMSTFPIDIAEHASLILQQQ